jgi:hypothetical protein
MRALTKAASGVALAFIGCAGIGYAALAAATWWRYGWKEQSDLNGCDSELEKIFPDYEVRERRLIEIAAPCDVTYSAAWSLKLEECAVVRALFRTRSLVFGQKDERRESVGLGEQARRWGWSVLCEVPGREIVFGGVTQPWTARPVFRGLPLSEFISFCEPGFAKIAWTLRVDPTARGWSLASTETRVRTTDAISRRKFRRYWAMVRPGAVLIRLAALRAVKQTAERTIQENRGSLGEMTGSDGFLGTA